MGRAVLGQHAALPVALGALLQAGGVEHHGLRQLLHCRVLRQERVQALPLAPPRLAQRLAGVPRHLAVPLSLLLLRQVLGAGLLPLRLLCHQGVLLLLLLLVPRHLLQLWGGLHVALHVLGQLVAAQALQLAPSVARKLPHARQAQICPMVLWKVLLLLLLLWLLCQVQVV